MDAWGCGSFDNEHAIAWLAAFDAESVPVLDAALWAVLEAPDVVLIPIEMAATAIAAAEIVACAFDGNLAGLPEPALEIFDGHRHVVVEGQFADIAPRAVERVTKASQLRELWVAMGNLAGWERQARLLVARFAF
jgi:hypothetical protein